ncbi:DMT family transporter [Rosistilla oblonga]|nr:DMT family transporter [Rosistilla oblonga]
MSRWMYLLIVCTALIGGAGLAAQPGVNSTLSRKMGHPLHAAIVSFGTGLLVLVVIAIFSGRFPPRFTDSVASLPWWAWLGGSIGAFLVTMSMIFAPRIGALQWIALIVTGQAIASLLLDHYGLAGFHQRSASGIRVLGAILLVAGLILSSLERGGGSVPEEIAETAPVDPPVEAER